jgi:hypothetical protein
MIVKTKNATPAQVYKWLYSMPIPSDVHFITLGLCRDCDAIMNILVEEQPKTVEDAIKLWAYKEKHEKESDFPAIWHEYPDSVLFRIRVFDPPKELGCATHGGIKVPISETSLKEGHKYLEYHYSR